MNMKPGYLFLACTLFVGTACDTQSEDPTNERNRDKG